MIFHLISFDYSMLVLFNRIHLVLINAVGQYCLMLRLGLFVC